ncbi:M23 family metallopeptidase [Gordonia phosphorivorans]|uniref:M23 family metallopeptidase n=1 Tax=Gordonia phosphorivorans TaxID=1056982 RepID=A0ABV6H777_9ACTN
MNPAAGQASRAGRHRVARSARTSVPARVGALAAFTGAVGLATISAGEAAAKPAAKSDAPVVLPGNITVPANLDLPKELDNAIRGLALPTLPMPGQAVKPASGTVTSNYGARWGAHHNGVDIANKIGTPVYAVTDGVVLESGPASGYGQWIRVRQDDGTTGIFGHVDQSFVRKGQRVTAGQQIGTVGNRGNSTGPHLHYEVWNAGGSPINPHAWLAKRGVHL